MIRLLIKVLIESIAVALVMTLVAKKPIAIDDVVRVTLSIAAVLMILSVLAPEVKVAVDKGMGLGLGLRQVEGFDEDAKNVRLNNVLYSGDIVNIVGGDVGKTDNHYIQRNVTSSEILLNDPIEDVHTNLSKLRFELVDHDPDSLKPIKYGDTLYIKHNANINNVNADRFIKISDNLLSHQEGPLFNQFQIINSASPGDNSNVKPDTPVVVKSLKSGGIPEGFLVVGDDKKFTSKATTSGDGTKFSIGLQRVAEANDRHLDISMGSTLYP